MSWLEIFVVLNLVYFSGNVVPGLPPFQLPWQSRDPPQIPVNGTMMHNPSSETIFDPMEILSDLGLGLFLLPIVSVLPQAAISQFYAGELSLGLLFIMLFSVVVTLL